MLPTTPVDLATGDFDLMTFARTFEEGTNFIDLNLTSPFSALNTTGVFTIGAGNRGTSQLMKQNFDMTAGTHNLVPFDPTSIQEPAISFPGVGPGFRLNTDTNTDEYGPYAQARVDLGARAILSLGTRYVIYDSKTLDTGRGIVRSDISERRFNSNIGLTYNINQNLTAYGSYSDIFQPQSEQQANGDQLNPVIGRQYELGLKGAFGDGRLITQTAVFMVEDTNRVIPDPNNPGAFLPGSSADTKGFEALAQRQIAENWMISAGTLMWILIVRMIQLRLTILRFGDAAQCPKISLPVCIWGWVTAQPAALARNRVG